MCSVLCSVVLTGGHCSRVLGCCVCVCVQVCEGETIRGTLSCKPNAKNPRDLDIVLEYHFEGKHCEAHRTQVRPAVAGWDGQHRCVQ
jgi:hypothetical protein